MISIIDFNTVEHITLIEIYNSCYKSSFKYYSILLLV